MVHKRTTSNAVGTEPSQAAGAISGLQCFRRLFVLFIITVFVSIIVYSFRRSDEFFDPVIGPKIRSNITRTVLVRVKESRDTISQMDTEELTALAREAVGLVKTAPSTAALLSNSTNTTAANSSLLLLDDPTAQTILLTTVLPAGTVPETEVSPGLKEAYKFIYGDSKHEKPLKNRPPCPDIPQSLIGEIKVFKDSYPMPQLNSLDFRVELGGSYSPPNCESKQKLAIIIPFRKREKHLSVLLLNLHPFLQKQQLSYTIFIVNQIGVSKFNRALLMNVGFMEAMKRDKYTCLVFHDVDLLPHNDKNLYTCPDHGVRHMSAYIDKFSYQLPYNAILGGVVAIRSDLFLKVNGYSNQFFGWGGEDDDFSARCKRKGIPIVRYPKTVARYKMIQHDKDSGNEANPNRFKMLHDTAERQPHDGINSIKYSLKTVTNLPLYTRINVAVNQTAVMNAGPRDTLPPFLTGG